VRGASGPPATPRSALGVHPTHRCVGLQDMAPTASVGLAQWRAPPTWRPQRRHGRHHLRALGPRVISTRTKNPKPAEVFLACVPLVGFEAIAAALGDVYPAQFEHVMVLVRGFDRTASVEDTTTVVCYDFLPIDPLAPATAAALLRGGEVAGDLRIRPLRGIPSRRCWKIGTYVPSVTGLKSETVTCTMKSASTNSTSTSDSEKVFDDDAHAAANAFQSQYPSRLCLRPDRKNTCVEHAEALVEHLTGISVRYEDLIRTPPNAEGV